MNVYKRLLRILKHRGEDLVLFEIVMRGVNVLIGSIVAFVINAVIEMKTGFAAVNDIFLTWIDVTYLGVLSVCILSLLFFAVLEIVGLVHISHSYERGERPSVLTTLKFSFMKALGVFHSYGLSAVVLIFFAFVLFPIFQVGPSVFRTFSVPSFLTDELIKSESRYILYISCVILTFYIVYRSIFFFHIYSTRSITLLGAIKASWLLTARKKSLRGLLTWSFLVPIAVTFALIAATAFVSLAAFALSNGIILYVARILPETLYIIFYSSWIFISTALLSVVIAPFFISVLSAYLEVKNPVVLGIDSDTHHYVDYPIFKNRFLVWIVRKKKHIFALGILTFIAFAFIVHMYIRVFNTYNTPPLIISHRGIHESGDFDKKNENLITSFDGAIAMRSNGIETDLQMLKDGTVVFYHDQNLSVYGLNDRLKDVTYDELLTAGIQLPTLEDFFARNNFNCSNVWLFEIKNYTTKSDSLEIADKLYAELKSKDMLSCSFMGSFDLSILSQIKKNHSDVMTNLYLYKTVRDSSLFKEMDAIDAISVEYAQKTSNLVRSYIDAGKPVFVWTVNNPNEIEHLINLGVTGIITDLPETMQNTIENREKSNTKKDARIIEVFGRTFFIDLSDIWQFKFRYSL